MDLGEKRRPGRRTSRAGSASVCRWPSPSSTTRSSSSSTSRRRAWIRPPGGRSGTSSLEPAVGGPHGPPHDPLHGGGRGPVRPDRDHGPRPDPRARNRRRSWSSRRFHERAVRFDAIEGLDDARLAAMPGVTRSVKREDGEVAALHARRPGHDRRGPRRGRGARRRSRRNLGVRRATLEDVFLDLTGRALRD